MWTPETFWKSTFFEYSHALVGWAKSNGRGPWAPRADGKAPWTYEEAEKVSEAWEEKKQRNPDLAKLEKIVKGSVPKEVRQQMKANRKKFRTEHKKGKKWRKP